MELSDERVRLRSWRAGDAARIAAIRRDPVLSRWSSMGDDILGWVSRQRARACGLSLAVTAVDDDRPLGKVALSPVAADVAELSYWLLPGARGRGLALAATRLYTGWAFETLRLRRIVVDVEADNEPSLRLAAALGARPTRTHGDTDRRGVRRLLVEHELLPPHSDSCAGG